MSTSKSDKPIISKKGKTLVKWLKIVIFLAVIVGIPLFLFLAVPDFGHILTDRETFRSFMEEHAKQGVSVYFVIQFLQVIMGFLPGQIIQFIGGYIFGIPLGFVLSILGTAIGTFVAFHLARHFGEAFVSLFVKEKNRNKFIEMMDSSKGYTIVILVYLVPGIPKDVFTYAAGLTRLRAVPFTIMSVIARAPAMLATILFSGFLEAGNYPGAVAVVIVIAVLLLTVFFTRKRIFALIERLHTKTRY
ncbi:TVP38/TMEM64 family protein [Clostridia bacterium]|nr:TVP38/TMEM64 family protein [Clostridia bacterium]